MNYDIENIEDAIISALKASDLSSVCKTIDTYHGEIDDLLQELKALLVKFPAIFVLYGGSKFSEAANRSYDDEQTFTIICIDENLRGRTALRIGIYGMLKITKASLIDNNLGLNIEPMHPVVIQPLLITKKVSVYGFDIKTSFSMD